MLEWFREAFAALPDAGRAFYQFFDPAGLGRGWVGLLITVLWIGPLLLLPAYLAKLWYGRREWLSATMAVLAASSFLFWIAGVLPHIWIQFAEANESLLAGVLIPESAGLTIGGNRIDVASNLYAVIVEGIVGALMVVQIIVALLLVLRAQRKYPKTLAAGETKPEAGGYK